MPSQAEQNRRRDQCTRDIPAFLKLQELQQQAMLEKCRKVWTPEPINHTVHNDLACLYTRTKKDHLQRVYDAVMANDCTGGGVLNDTSPDRKMTYTLQNGITLPYADEWIRTRLDA